MSNLAYDSNVHSVPDVKLALPGEELNALTYHARGAKLDVQILPQRDGPTLKLTGQVLPRSDNGRHVAGKLKVELLDGLGLVATTGTNEGGDFQFAGLSRGIYHIRISGSDWKLGIFGLTA